MDEFPPAYLLDANNPAFIYAGKDKRGQRVRYIPWTDNQDAGQSWKGIFFVGVLDSMSDKDLQDLITKSPLSKPTNPQPQKESVNVAIAVDRKPKLIFDWDLPANPSQDDGLGDNGCWPKDIAVGDPGFALLSLDDWYDSNKVGLQKTICKGGRTETNLSPRGRFTAVTYVSEFRIISSN